MSPARPARLVVVAGTGTEVGKTWVTAHVARELRAAGTVVAARKPAQSFEPGDVEAGRTDAQLLGEATGTAAAAVCPPHRWFEVPMAPPMAADALGRAPFTLDELVAELVWPDGVDVGVVETAGGLRSPLADDGDAVTLVRALAPDVVVLVADAGLGTINLVRLSVGALGGFVAGTRRATELLVNRARSYIFTTASTPADAAAALANLRVLRAPEGDALVARLRANVDRVAPGHPSPIVPIVVGDEDDAVEAAAAMLDRGFLVPAIRPPTVPLGSSRLRITLSAAHDDAQIDGLLAALGDLGLGA